VSAFSPISHPSRCPWGQKALGAYLGNNPLLWQEWDACQLLRHHDSPPLPTLVDVGLDDPFLAEQLGIDTLAEWPPPGVAPDAQPPCRLRPQLLLHGELHRGAPALSRHPGEPA
jgi:hypothetical protein